MKTTTLRPLILALLTAAPCMRAMESNNNKNNIITNEHLLTTTEKRLIHLKNIKSELSEWNTLAKNLANTQFIQHDCNIDELMGLCIYTDIVNNNERIFQIKLESLAPKITYEFTEFLYDKGYMPCCSPIVIDKSLLNKQTFNQLQGYLLNYVDLLLKKLIPSASNFFTPVLHNLSLQDPKFSQYQLSKLFVNYENQVTNFTDAFENCIKYLDLLENELCHKSKSLKALTIQCLCKNPDAIITFINANTISEDLIEEIIQESTSEIWHKNTRIWLNLLSKEFISEDIKWLIIERCFNRISMHCTLTRNNKKKQIFFQYM